MVATTRNDGGYDLPDWVPQAARHYIAHTEGGTPIRALAREAEVHASTVLRQIRRYEGRRDDPLVDDALRHLSGRAKPADAPAPAAPPDGDRLGAEGTRVLRRLVEPGAILAVARDMEKGVIVREDADGAAQRTGVVDRDIAEALALREWIACTDAGARIVRYRITSAGRAALRELIASVENRARGFAEGVVAFRSARGGGAEPRPVMAESPLNGLARRRDRDGTPFLSRDLVAAGERLREDFELARMAAGPAPDWSGLLAGGGAVPVARTEPATSSARARDRVATALGDLGPGLGDVALRACCLLEGMESLEQRMGWSARSGKIVLRIALQRLQRHYREVHGAYAPRIG